MHAHPGALAILAACSVATYLGPGKAEIGRNLLFHLFDGQRPRPTHSKGTYPKDTVGGGTYGLISQTNYWCCLYRYCLTRRRTALFGPADATRQKNPIDSRELRRA